MKKLIIAVLAVALFAFIASSVQAEEKYVAGGFEAAGHVIAGGGYQHQNNKATTYYAFDGDYGYFAGPIGKYLGQTPAARTDHFSFFVDEVELDIMKSFGENIRLRADMDFGRAGIVNSSTGFYQPSFVLEQGYATANIPLGNGVEILFGRFNTPIGFESVDVNDNDTISKSVIGTALRPTNTTGVKLYYAFSDLVDFHFYVVNSLTQDSNVKINDVPSLGFRLGFNWGEKGNESTFGISGIFGPESRLSNKHFTYGTDVDLNWWVTEAFALGLEGIYRRDNAVTNTVGVVAGNNVNYYGGLINLHYAFSDVWDGTLKYAYAKQTQASTTVAGAALFGSPWNLTGAQQQVHQFALAGAYAVADGAKLKLEGRMDVVKPNVASTTQYVYGGALAFAYDF